MIDYEKIGLKIKENRKKFKLTQQELGDKIGKTKSSIQKYEKGLTQIPNDVLEKLAKVFQMTIFDLAFEETQLSLEPLLKPNKKNLLWNWNEKHLLWSLTKSDELLERFKSKIKETLKNEGNDYTNYTFEEILSEEDIDFITKEMSDIFEFLLYKKFTEVE